MKFYSTTIFDKRDLKTIEYFSENAKKNPKEWLTLKKVFKRPGKQGLVGIFEGKWGEKFVFKVSQYVNYLPQHELTIMRALNEVAMYCPHFTYGYGAIQMDVNPHGCHHNINNPFDVEQGVRPVKKDVLLMSHISDADKLCNHVLKNPNEDMLYSAVKQVLCAVSIAQKKVSFTHYDLHSNNVMMKKCDPNMVILYILPEGQFLIPTYGYYPVIIDFGFGFVEKMNGGWMWPSLGHTEVGFLSDRFDKVADPKLFLVTISDEINVSKKSERSKKLRKLVKKIYGCLDIQWDSGWDNGSKSASDYVTDAWKKITKKSRVFSNYDVYAYDIIQTLIKLPLKKKSYKDLPLHYSNLVDEFCKIEREVGSPMYCLYVLSAIVDSIRECYQDASTGKSESYKFVGMSAFERVKDTISYCRFKDVNFEKLTTSLLKVCDCAEGIMYRAMKKVMKRKNREYSQLTFDTPEKVCAYIDYKIPCKYTFSERSRVLVVDSVKERNGVIVLDESERERLNKVEECVRGEELHKLLEKYHLSS